MKKFIDWFLSLFKSKAKIQEIPVCTLRPDPYRPLAARRKGPGGRKPRPPKPVPTPTPVPVPEPTPTPTPVPVPGAYNHLLFFNFDGGTVKHVQWNGGVQFTLAPSTMSAADREQALWAAMDAYAPWKITITDKIAEYNNHSGPKQQVFVSPTSAWYPNPGFTGVAAIGSFGNGTPAFVFEDRLYSRYDYVGDIMVHEAGHTLGLAHQSEYTAACVFVQTYKRGLHMGSPFGTDAQWTVGPTYSCTTIQDDKGILNQKLGLK